MSETDLRDIALAVEESAWSYGAPDDFRAGVRATREAIERVFDERVAQATDARNGVVAHELRTPLTVVGAALSTLAEHVTQLSGADTLRLLATAARHVDNLQTLLDHLLSSSEDRGHFPVTLEDIELGALARQIVHDLGVITDPRAVVTEIPDAAHPVNADPQALRRIIAALISNAVKYSPPQTPIDVAVEATDHRIALRVSDRGDGIPPNQHDLIFQKGRRLDNTDVNGSGLGLYLARGLARAQGGSLAVESRTDGAGSTFVLQLPRAADDHSVPG